MPVKEIRLNFQKHNDTFNAKAVLNNEEIKNLQFGKGRITQVGIRVDDQVYPMSLPNPTMEEFIPTVYAVYRTDELPALTLYTRSLMLNLCLNADSRSIMDDKIPAMEPIPSKLDLLASNQVLNIDLCGSLTLQHTVPTQGAAELEVRSSCKLVSTIDDIEWIATAQEDEKRKLRDLKLSVSLEWMIIELPMYHEVLRDSPKCDVIIHEIDPAEGRVSAIREGRLYAQGHQIKFFMEKGCEDLAPTRAHDDDSGFDVRASLDMTVDPHSVRGVPTGVHMEMGRSRHFMMEIQVRPRSGLAIKHMITVLNTPGTIDNGYRGEVVIILANLSDKPFEVKRGDRIAQLVPIMVPIVKADVLNLSDEVTAQYWDHICDTPRATGGFGSTGLS